MVITHDTQYGNFNIHQNVKEKKETPQIFLDLKATFNLES